MVRYQNNKDIISKLDEFLKTTWSWTGLAFLPDYCSACSTTDNFKCWIEFWLLQLVSTPGRWLVWCCFTGREVSNHGLVNFVMGRYSHVLRYDFPSKPSVWQILKEDWLFHFKVYLSSFEWDNTLLIWLTTMVFLEWILLRHLAKNDLWFFNTN